MQIVYIFPKQQLPSPVFSHIQSSPYWTALKINILTGRGHLYSENESLPSLHTCQMGSKHCDANNKSIGAPMVDTDYHCYTMKFLVGISSWLHADSVSYFLLWRSCCKRACEMLPHSRTVSVCVKRLVIESSAFNVETFSYPRAFRARCTRILTGHYTTGQLGGGGQDSEHESWTGSTWKRKDITEYTGTRTNKVTQTEQSIQKEEKLDTRGGRNDRAGSTIACASRSTTRFARHWETRREPDLQAAHSPTLKETVAHNRLASSSAIDSTVSWTLWQ